MIRTFIKVTKEVEGSLEKTIKGVLGKVRKRGDISDSTLDYFLVNNPKLGRFYLLPKIHKRLHHIPGRPVIYRRAQINFEKRKKVKLESFHVHFSEEGHYGEKNWVITLLDSVENVGELRKNESFWQHELNTFQPLGLNEREVPLLF